MTVCKFFDKNFVLLDIVFIQFRLVMPIGKTVFSQLMDLVPEYEFKKCVDKYSGDFHALKFTCRDQFRVMSFAQFTDRASLRDIEANGLDVLPVEAGAYYLIDKGYVDFWRLYNYFHLRQAYFVTRAKDNMRFKVIEERPVDMHAGLISDQSIRLTGTLVSKDYPEMMRMVVYEDYATNNVYRFLTNNFTIEALTVAELYRERWQIELFFKWIKQHLHVKSFFGTTKNAVFAQIWIAVCDYLLLVIAKKMFHIEQNLYIFSQAIGLVLFEKMPVSELFNRIDNSKLEPENDGQGWLF